VAFITKLMMISFSFKTHESLGFLFTTDTTGKHARYPQSAIPESSVHVAFQKSSLDIYYVGTNLTSKGYCRIARKRIKRRHRRLPL